MLKERLKSRDETREIETKKKGKRGMKWLRETERQTERTRGH